MVIAAHLRATRRTPDAAGGEKSFVEYCAHPIYCNFADTAP
jgi:hypothetical protein